MRSAFKIIIVIVCLLSLSGCAIYKIVEGHYNDLLKEAEEKVQQSGGHPSTKDLDSLCVMHGLVKGYDQFYFKCVNDLEENIKRGDKEYMGIDFSAEPDKMRGYAYLQMGQYAQAIEASKKAYPIASNELIKMAIVGQLGQAYALNGDRKSALEMVNQLDQSKAGALYQYSIKLYAAQILVILGEHSTALERLKRINWDNYTITVLQSRCLLEKGDPNDLGKAREGYDAALSLKQITDDPVAYWAILYDRGRVAEREGKLKEAISFYAKAVDVVEQRRSTVITEVAKIGFVGDKQALYASLVQALYQEGQHEKAFEYVERAKSRALVDALASKQDFARQGRDGSEIKKVLAMNSAVDAELFNPDTTRDKTKTRSLQVKVRGDLERMAPELASLVTVSSPTIAEIQTYIRPDEALIEYFYKDDDMYVFILSDGKLQILKLGSRGLAEEVENLRKQIGDPGSTRFMESAGRLHARLFKPIESVVSKKNLIIVAHGALHYLPFSALHDGEGFLIDRYSIRMMPSAGAMKYLVAKNAGRKGNLIVFGNPDLGDPRFDLPFAEKEALEITKKKLQSKIFLRKDATVGAFARYAGDFGYIHLATHGRFDPVSPLKSALLLAPEPGSNGMLTADQLYSLELSANLVTLSACETGLSKIANGDDLVGLTRGFLYAGSRSIVATLWKVDDLATSHLMALFYGELEKTNKREALRTAQLQTKLRYPHPFYWASFQLTGNAD